MSLFALPSKFSPAIYKGYHSAALIVFYLYLFTFFGAVDIHHLALTLLLFYIVIWAFQNWRDWRHSYLTWLTLAAMAYVASRYLIPSPTEATNLNWNFDNGWPFIRLAGPVSLTLVPFLSGINLRRNLKAALAIIILGLALELIRTVFIGPEARGLAHIETRRPGFGMGPISFSMVCGFAAIIVIVFGNSIRRRLWAINPLLGVVAIITVAAALLFLLAALIKTESVSNWGATTVALAYFLLLNLLSSDYREKITRNVVHNPIPILLITVSVILAIGQWDLIEKRLKSKNLDAATLYATETNNFAQTVLGPRHKLFSVGFETFKDYPIFGALPAGVEARLTDANSNYSHVHSLPIQILASFGIVGSLIVLAFIFISFREVKTCRRTGLISEQLANFIYTIFIFTAFSMLFDIGLKYRGTVALLGFMAAIPISLQISRLKKRRLGDEPTGDRNSNEEMGRH